MTYPTLMVHMDMGPSHAGLLGVVADLAARFDAGVIGITACQPLDITADSYGFGDVIQQDRDDIARMIQASEAEFRTALASRADRLEWRSLVTTRPLADFIAHEARGADLVIAGPGPGPALADNRAVDFGSLVLQAGRPVLIVPQGIAGAALERVFVGWNDTPEARRAIAAALPILRRAKHVTVATIVHDLDMAVGRGQVADVVTWLGHHGIEAHAVVAPSSGDDMKRLGSLADEDGADLIVAGAYGHSRIREWAMGGVTRDLLLHGTRCAMLAH